MSLVYSMSDAACTASNSYNTLILGDGSDDRARAMSIILGQKGVHIQRVLIIKYQKEYTLNVQNIFPDAEVFSIEIGTEQANFLIALKQQDKVFQGSVLMDISCIHTPEMFILLKYLKETIAKDYVEVAYSFPFDYRFEKDPFISYTSYHGNLKTNDLLGFGGTLDGTAHPHMVVFLGFEGALSSKVTEDIQFDNLILVNNVPSFFPKYKDISVVNNYNLLTTRLMYVPADNPFATYNFLDSILSADEPACIAPLSTKPVALGVCIYALGHKNLRVVYPVSDQYNHLSTNKVLSTSLYGIKLN